MNFERTRPSPNPTSRARSLRARMTWTEQRLWRELRKLDANFRRQAPIGRFFADFASHGRKLVIEVDGGVHERLDEVALRDAERQRWLEGEGYTVLRFTSRQVEGDLFACVEQVKALLDGGALGGVATEVMEGRELAPEPNSAHRFSSLRTPPSPTLPPSRRKGE